MNLERYINKEKDIETQGINVLLYTKNTITKDRNRKVGDWKWIYMNMQCRWRRMVRITIVN